MCSSDLNSGQKLIRLDYRINTWDVEFRKYILKLEKQKNVILCGDLNVAHKEIDIHNPKTNKRKAGFTKEERDSFDLLLKNTTLIDSFRYLHPDKIEYSYWTYWANARKNNKGWRLDYFLISENLKKQLKKSEILTKIQGSDHAPIMLSF